MKIKNLTVLILIFFSCNNADNSASEKSSSSGTEKNINKNSISVNIDSMKNEDNSPLILFNKKTDTSKESISISGVFNAANSHIGLLIVSDTGILSPGKYQLQQKNEKLTNGRYETNINGGATAPENTLYKATGAANIISIDTLTKKIVADFEMDAVNKAKEKVHLTGHVNSTYK